MRHSSATQATTESGQLDFPHGLHGFRSAFRDWASEETNFRSYVVEQCLAHLVGNSVERAYRRGDILEKRRAVMDAWAKFLRVRV